MSNIASVFSGCLMTVSLLAVPCVAVFGLPSVGQAVTEPDSKNGVTLRETADLGSASAAPPAATTASSFAPLVDAGQLDTPASSSKAPATPQAHLEPTSDHRGAVANAAVGLGESSRTTEPAAALAASTPSENAFAPADTEVENVFAPANADTPSAVCGTGSASWEEAVARLGEFGIRDFHLTNGEVAGQFHFSCSVKSTRPKITRRFEAEGPTPVAAAEDVLAQVEQCFGTP